MLGTSPGDGKLLMALDWMPLLLAREMVLEGICIRGIRKKVSSSSIKLPSNISRC